MVVWDRIELSTHGTSHRCSSNRAIRPNGGIAGNWTREFGTTSRRFTTKLRTPYGEDNGNRTHIVWLEVRSHTIRPYPRIYSTTLMVLYQVKICYFGRCISHKTAQVLKPSMIINHLVYTIGLEPITYKLWVCSSNHWAMVPIKQWSVIIKALSVARII